MILAFLMPAAFFAPFIGLLGWTWISYFNPHQFTFGFTRTLPVGLMIAVPTLLGLLLTRNRRLPPFTRETGLLILLWIWFAITTAHVYVAPELSHHAADTSEKLFMVSKMLVMIFVSMMLVTTATRLRQWYWMTAAIFAFFALKASIFGILTGGQWRIYGPEYSMIADNNDFGLAVAISLPMFVCLAKTERSKFLRRVFWISIPLGVIAVILTYSRGDMLGLAALMAIWVWKSKYKVLATVGMLVVVMAVFAYAPQAWIQRMETIRTAPETDASAQSRLRSWTFALKLSRDHPGLGGGFETFTLPLYAQYGVDDTHGPHSIYFQVLAEHGFPGLLIFLSLIASCWFSCRKLTRDFRRSASYPYLADYAVMVQTSMIPFVISGAFLGRAYFDLFYQLVATVIILKGLARQEQRPLYASTSRGWKHGDEFIPVEVGSAAI